jgi:hypothetical protein
MDDIKTFPQLPPEGKGNLLPADLERFEVFGIGLELLQDAAERVTDEEARERGFNGNGNNAGILFIYLDPVSGRRLGVRLRRDFPEMENGKPVRKYLWPYSDRRHLFFPPACRELLNDASVPIVLVESEKACLALAAFAQRSGRKLLAVACGGCWGGRAATR